MSELVARLVETAAAEFQNCPLDSFEEFDYEAGARGAVAAVLRELAAFSLGEIDVARASREPWYGLGPAHFDEWADELEAGSDD